MSYIKEVAKILGVKISEEFYAVSVTHNNEYVGTIAIV